MYSKVNKLLYLRLQWIQHHTKILGSINFLKHVPIIFLTAKSTPDDMLKGINIGARHYIAKPFGMKEVLDKVAKVLKGA